MLTSLQRLRNCQTPLKQGLFSLTKPTHLLRCTPKRSFASNSVNEKESEETAREYEFDEKFEQLIADRVNEVYNPETLKKNIEELLLETHKSPEEHHWSKLKTLHKALGPNFHHLMNARFNVVVDALKSGPLTRETFFSYQNSLEKYKFRDGYDYEVLDRDDEVKALNRMTYVELHNSYIQNKLKYVIKEDDHFSKYEREYVAKDYLKGKPDNYMAVFNIPLNSSAGELIKIFSKYGKVLSYNIQRSFIGIPAFFEVCYESRDSVFQAKTEKNRSRYNGKTLYVKTAEDSEYEDPVHRTLVVYNINPSDSLQTVIENLSNFGNVMHFEMAIIQEITRLPTPEEAQRFVEQNNLTENGKYKIKMVKHKYEVEGGQLRKTTFSENNGLEVKDNRPMFNDEKVLNQDVKTTLNQSFDDVEIEQEKKYSKMILGDPEEKVLEVNDISQFKLEKSSVHTQAMADAKSQLDLRYYLRRIEEIKAKTSRNSGLSLAEKIELNNLLEKPISYNLGYCFVTYSHTDEAKKAMLEIPVSDVFGTEIGVTLKRDEGHMDWDPEYFIQTYEKVKDHKLASSSSILEQHSELFDKEHAHKDIEAYKDRMLGENLGHIAVNDPVRKDTVEPKKSPEDWALEIMDQHEQEKEKVKQEMEVLFEKESAVMFSDKSFAEKQEQTDEEEEEYPLGRSYAQVGDKQFKKFENLLTNKKTKKQEQLRTNTEDIDRRAVEEFLLNARGLKGEDSGLLRRFREELLDKNPAARLAILEDRLAELHDFGAEITKTGTGSFRKPDEKEEVVVAEEVVAEPEEEKVEEKEDMHFNPFQKDNERKRKFPVVTPVDDTETDVKYLKKKREYMNKVSKIEQGEYSKSELLDDVESAIADIRQRKSISPHYMEKDKEGKPFISYEDEERFEDEKIPDDPEERVEYLRKRERMRQLEELNWYKEMKNAAPGTVPIADFMLSKGFPLDSYHFEPSEDCQTIDEFIDKMRAANPKYHYEKSTDEEGKDIVIKFVRHKNLSGDFEFPKTEEDMQEFVEELSQYLMDNGIPEEIAKPTMFQGTLQDYAEAIDAAGNQEPTEMDQKIIELLLKKYPRDIVEKFITTDPFTDPNYEQTVKDVMEKLAFDKKLEENREMTKDDFVKYSSMVFNVKDSEGKNIKSKYDKV